MKTFFSIRELEDGWDFNDFLEADGMAEDYCVSVLEIPQEYIKDIKLKNSYFEIELEKTKEYLHDDWYINLLRASELAKCA